jgi:hypothetical protein
MCNKKRLGQTAALLLVGMAVGLAGGAFAADSTVPKEWNINSNFKSGASLEAFGTKPTWVGALGDIEAVSAGLPSGRANAWFTGDTTVLNMTNESVIATNTLIADDNLAVSFATDPVYVDARVKLVVLADAPSTNGAKLAIYASAADKLKVVHNGGTTEYTVTGKDLTADWHQLTVKLNTAGTFDVLVDDGSVATGLTLIGGTSDTTLNQLEFSGTGKLDQLYVSHGDPKYAGTMGAIPNAITSGGLTTEPAVNNWLARRIYNGGTLTTNTTFAGFTKAKLDAAYLLDKLNVASGAATLDYTFGSEEVVVVSDTQVNVKCSLTVTGGTGTLARRLKLLGKATIGGTWSEVANADDLAYSDGKISHTFTGINPANYKFFKAQIIPIP